MASAPPTSTLLAGLDWLADHRDLIAARFYAATANSDEVVLHGDFATDVADDLGLPFDKMRTLGVQGVMHRFYRGQHDGVWVRLVSVEREAVRRMTPVERHDASGWVDRVQQHTGEPLKVSENVIGSSFAANGDPR